MRNLCFIRGMKSRLVVRIGSRRIGEGQPVFVIAEVGVNHNGSVAMAKKLIDVSKVAGADAVKFQTFDPDELVTTRAPKAAYQEKTAQGESHYGMLKRLQLSMEDHKALKAHAKKRGILFISTPFSIPDALSLMRLKVPAFKVSSTDTSNHPHLEVIAKAQVPVILSTGMSSLAEVQESVEVIKRAGNDKIIVLHCTTAYPTEDSDVNLRAMITMREKLGTLIGYSDHTPGIEVSATAAALGAHVIEKHITLDRTLPGPDHFASLEPQEFAQMVTAIRRAERIMGHGVKEPTSGERTISKVARKSVVATRAIKKGERIFRKDITFKRPGTGFPPNEWKRVVGKRAARNIEYDHIFSRRDLV